MKSLKSATLLDQVYIINIETTFLRALPRIDIVGLASTTIKESAMRVKSALQSIPTYQNPSQQILISLTPSDIKKDGSHFDLPIALLILLQKEEFDGEFFVFGELGLDGAVKGTNELFSILLFLSTQVKGVKVLVPKDVASKVAMIPNLEVFCVESLEEAQRFFCDKEFAKNCEVKERHPLFENTLKIGEKEFVINREFALDFYDIKGQNRAKRACLVAAAGMHNILLEGSAGCGKSMCAKRLRYILPPQSLEEILLSTAYASLERPQCDFDALRPYRSPHHTSTRSSIFGGGSGVAKIGEVALANGGMLFFDEFPHFSKQILESLREPLEDNEINISRVNSKVNYKTKFLFFAAQNPCPCGNHFSKTLPCHCSPRQIETYKSAISTPLMERIDVYCAMGEVSAKDTPSVRSSELYEQVLGAFKIQVLREQGEFNGKLSDEQVRQVCRLDKEASDILEKAVSAYNLSQRTINKTLKVARTIADLRIAQKFGDKLSQTQAKSEIDKGDLLEALSYRLKS